MSSGSRTRRTSRSRRHRTKRSRRSCPACVCRRSLPSSKSAFTYRELGCRRHSTFSSRRARLSSFGPPGTGKTYVALALAEEMTREGGAFRIVQFHPSYSYEDFFEGYRPAQADGGVGSHLRADSGAATSYRSRGG